MKASRFIIASLLSLLSFDTLQSRAAQFVLLREVLPNLAPGTDSHPRVADISSDGSTVIGSYLSTEGGLLYQWKIGIGVTILLDNSGQPLQGSVVAVSGDGKTILGTRIYGSPYSTPFIWTEGLGVQDLPWNSGQLKDMSADGSAILANILAFNPPLYGIAYHSFCKSSWSVALLSVLAL